MVSIPGTPNLNGWAVTIGLFILSKTQLAKLSDRPDGNALFSVILYRMAAVANDRQRTSKKAWNQLSNVAQTNS